MIKTHSRNYVKNLTWVIIYNDKNRHGKNCREIWQKKHTLLIVLANSKNSQKNSRHLHHHPPTKHQI